MKDPPSRDNQSPLAHSICISKKSKFQNKYRFRKQHSPLIASLHLTYYYNFLMDQMSTPLCIFLDLSKPSDTLNHKIVLSKLIHYGIKGISYYLLSTYLANRKQYVQFDSSCSKMLHIQHGVPQGSISWGPFYFLYILMLFQMPVNFSISNVCRRYNIWLLCRYKTI